VSDSSVGSSAPRPTKYRQRASSTPSVTACAKSVTERPVSRDGTSIARRRSHGTARANSAARSRTSVASIWSGVPIPTATRTGPPLCGCTKVWPRSPVKPAAARPAASMPSSAPGSASAATGTASASASASACFSEATPTAAPRRVEGIGSKSSGIVFTRPPPASSSPRRLRTAGPRRALPRARASGWSAEWSGCTASAPRPPGRRWPIAPAGTPPRGPPATPGRLP